MKLSLEKVEADNENYKNTYPKGAYSWSGDLRWIDNDTLEFKVNLAYNFMDIIENVTLKYNYLDKDLEYVK